MPRRRKALLLLALGLFVCGLVVIQTRTKEPSYDGRTLSEWMEILGSDLWSDQTAHWTESRQEVAADAIRHIGTNALPYLLSWINYEPPPWRSRIETLSMQLPRWTRTRWPMESLLLAEEPELKPYRALKAFEVLGTVAAPAAPDLIRQIKETASDEKAGMAMRALARIGPETTPALISILSSPGQASNSWSIDCIIIMGTNARPLVPLLLERLQSSEERATFVSAEILKELKIEPELVVPALTKALNDPRSLVKIKAAEILEVFGRLAPSALPALTNALSDSNPYVRQTASNAIAQITGAILTNAPAR